MNRFWKANIFKWLLVLVALCCFLESQWQFRDSLEDDAYISFRYARNWLDGHGLVYNPGERVEGYTNLLWVMILALFGFVGCDFELTAMWGGAFLGFVLLLVVASISIPQRVSESTVRRKPVLPSIKPTWTGAAAALLIGTNPAFQAEAAMGLETILFTLLVTLGIWSLTIDMSRQRISINPSIWLSLAAWTRPEGFWVGGFVLAIQFIHALRVKSLRANWLHSFLLFVFFVVLIEGFRLSYYGEWFPNTFQAKTGAGLNQLRKGWGYSVNFFTQFGVFTLIAAILAPVVLFRKNAFILIPVFWICLQIIYVIIIGGDYKPSHRFFIPILPTLYLMLIHSLSFVIDLLDRKHEGDRSFLKIISLAAALIAYLMVSLPRYSAVDDFMIASRSKLRIDRSIADWFRQNARPGETLATEVAGRIPYYTGMVTYDMSGLNDRHIAQKAIPYDGFLPAGHDRTDAPYIISRKPDYILFHSILVTDHPNPELRRRQINYFESEIWKVPSFHTSYSLRSVKLNTGAYLNFFQRASFDLP